MIASIPHYSVAVGRTKQPQSVPYDGGFLWQQPATVLPAAYVSDRGSVTRVDQTPVRTSPDSGLGAASTQPEAFFSTSAPSPGPIFSEGLYSEGRHPDRERGFLETVLGPPKAAVNQEPYVNTSLLQRSKRPAPELSASQADHEGFENGVSEDALSPRIIMRGRETKTRFSGSGI